MTEARMVMFLQLKAYYSALFTQLTRAEKNQTIDGLRSKANLDDTNDYYNRMANELTDKLNAEVTAKLQSYQLKVVDVNS